MNYVYITTNPCKTCFHTGVTDHLVKCIREQQAKYGKLETLRGRYNRVNLLYFETFDSPFDAIKREGAIKKLCDRKKLKLIKILNPDLSFLCV